MPESFLDRPVMHFELSDGSTAFRSMGSGSPVLLIHGYPQTHVCWHRIAAGLAGRYEVVAPDLPGYGDSRVALDDDARFSKRAMAASLVELMRELGHERFAVVGHDRGARVAYRMALDHPDIVESLTVIDIVPTIEEWEMIDGPGSIDTFHWPFLAQPDRLPETLISGAADTWLGHLMASWSTYPERISSDAMEEYRRCFRQRSVIDGTCADYRAGATIDTEHDDTDRNTGTMIHCPVLVLASEGRGDLTTTWTRWATDVRCEVLDGGHFLPEENPDAVLDALRTHLDSGT
ncbi:MAG: alpha/beta hydrolase [Actinomycetota bacterium]